MATSQHRFGEVSSEKIALAFTNFEVKFLVLCYSDSVLLVEYDIYD